VKPEEEELVRKAGALVDTMYETYRAKYNRSDLTPEYLLTFVAVDLAKKYLRLDADSNTETLNAELETMASQLRQYLNR
jgi:hypothetical protein